MGATINDYQKGKEAARQYAIETQQLLTETNTSYEEIAIIQARLVTLGKRYGLMREFKENGIL